MGLTAQRCDVEQCRGWRDTAGAAAVTDAAAAAADLPPLSAAARAAAAAAAHDGDDVADVADNKRGRHNRAGHFMTPLGM